MLSEDEIKRRRFAAKNALASQRLEDWNPIQKSLSKWSVLLLENLKQVT